MKARCGCKIIKIKDKEYEVPIVCDLLISNSGDFFYVSGIKKEEISFFKSNYYYILKNICTNKFDLVDFDIIDRKITNDLIRIYNVDNNDYALPIKYTEEADFLVKKFHKYNLKPIKEFKLKFEKYLIK